MSKATKRKHVVKEILEDYVLPEDTHEIVRVCQPIPTYGGRILAPIKQTNFEIIVSKGEFAHYEQFLFLLQ